VRTLICWLAVAFLLVPDVVQAQAQTPRRILKVGEQLQAGQYIVSSNNAFFAAVTPDGFFDVYRGSGPSDNKGIVWSTRTTPSSTAPQGSGFGPSISAVVSQTGTLAIVAASRLARWTSDSIARPPGNYFLALHDDGSLRIHLGTEPANYLGTVWTSAQGAVAAPFAGFSGLSAVQRAALSPQQLAALPAALTGAASASPAQLASPAKPAAALSARDEMKARQEAEAAKAKAAAEQAEAAKLKAVDDAAIAAEKGQAPRSVLKLGESLVNNQYLVSPNGAFFALLKQNGVFGVYRGNRPSDNKGLVWSPQGEIATGLRPVPPQYSVFVRQDGKLHLAEILNREPRDLWVSPTNNAFPAGGNYFLALSDDGSLRVHVGTEMANRSGTVWTSAQGLVAAPFAEFSKLTAAQAAALTPMQLTQLPRALAATVPAQPVVYKAMGPLLQSNSAALLKVGEYLVSPGKTAFAILQGDGNFVVYRGSSPSDNKGVIWNTATFGRGTAGPSLFYEVGIGQEGTLGVYANRAQIWSSNSGGKPGGNYFVFLDDDGTLGVYSGLGAQRASHSGVLWTNRAGLQASQLAQFPTLSPAQRAGMTATQVAAYDTEKAAREAAIAKAKADAAAAKAALDAAVARAAAAEAAARAAEAEAVRIAALPFATGANILKMGKIVTQGQYMVSASKTFFAIMQTSGNFCHYRGSGPADNKGLIWCSGTGDGPGQPYYAAMQRDGNFCVRRGTPTADRGSMWCTLGTSLPQGAGIEYYALIQDDSNFVIYADISAAVSTAGMIFPYTKFSAWNRIAAAEEGRSGWDKFKDSVSGAYHAVAAAVSDTAATVAAGTVDAANITVSTTRAVANEAKRAADDAAKTAAQTARAAESLAVSTANTVAKETVSISNTVATGTVSAANTFADETTRVSVTVGKTVVNGSQIVGNEIVEAGKVVGYAVADLATEAWQLLKGNCGSIGRRFVPIDAYFLGAKGIAGVISTYGNDDMKKQVDQASQCFEWVQDGFYCAIPSEMEKLVSQATNMPGNLVALASRVFNEAKTTDCLAAGAATVHMGGAGLHMCAMGKVMVTDATKAYKCFSAAHSSGATRKLLPAMPPFPTKTACNGLGEISLQAAQMVFTRGMSAEAKLMVKAGKGNTALVVADKLRSLYSTMGKASIYQEMVDSLEKMPECRD
jgi:hypothetical protein